MNKLISFFSYLIDLSKFFIKIIGAALNFLVMNQCIFGIYLSFEMKNSIALISILFANIIFCILSVVYYIFEKEIYRFIKPLFMFFLISTIISVKTELFNFISGIMIINIVLFMLNYIKVRCESEII